MIEMAYRIKFNFKGLMAPVFTFFNDDVDRSVNTDSIADYAEFLSKNGIKGVLVNGTTGEGPVMSVKERKLVTEAWKKCCQKLGLTLMVQIGGAPLPDVIDLAKHAESIKVDAILCLPDLYFKPKTVDHLVLYLQNIARYCSNIPILYYHIPMFTGLNLHMPTFCESAEKNIVNFVGLKYTSGDLDQGSDCLKEGRSVFLGADTILSGALTLGFDSAIMTTLNIRPELAVQIMNAMSKGQIKEAQRLQKELTDFVKHTLQIGGGEWVPSMKKIFNIERKINAGPVRIID
ncbi:N-acetylneuraminate lyase A-like [Condylostylus longicornis]|uniref:N-acetylneuraminate lyase A-like n=1 Tax=Condylostylus longicornis TaxID=2530218 RepID=UPI00244E15B4|nr:N-acetylneuraminate lyase A-like [Condylostylus longicornis]